MPWRKRTRILTSLSLQDQRLLCQCKGPHLRLTGYSSAHRMPWTKVAEPYPRKLNHLFAQAMSESLRPLQDRRRVEAALVCSYKGERVGEAANPGPEDTAGLEDVDLVGERTRALQAKLLGEFERWLAENLSAPARTSVDSSAMVFCSVLRAYGNHFYMTGQPLYKWRHLCAFYQKNQLLLRPYMRLCWDLVTRWERICPTVHRNPVPVSVAKAMMSLALGWGWPRMAAVIGLSFHGVARVGEPLGAVRSCLLLPCDILEEETSSLYVRVEKPKTGNRGSGRVQQSVVRGARLRLLRAEGVRSRGAAVWSFPVRFPETLGQADYSSRHSANAEVAAWRTSRRRRSTSVPTASAFD